MDGEEFLLAVIRAAATGFSEGLVYAGRAVVFRARDGASRSDSLESLSEVCVSPAAVSPEEAAGIGFGPSRDSEREGRVPARDETGWQGSGGSSGRAAGTPVVTGGTPYELAQAMSAMTKPVPDGMFDPMDETDARPQWLQ